MIWHRDSRKKSDGGYWRCAVKWRASKHRYRKTEKGLACEARHHARNNPKRIQIGSTYIGMEHHFPVDRETVISHLNRKRDQLLAKQAAEREAFNESFSR